MNKTYRYMSTEESDFSNWIEQREDGTFDYWAVDASGDWSADCKKGREVASTLMGVMYPLDEAGPPNEILLGYVARAIIEKGRYSGVEVGFFQEIAESLPHGGGSRMWRTMR